MGLFDGFIVSASQLAAQSIINAPNFVGDTVWNGRKTTYILQRYVTNVKATTVPGVTSPWKSTLGGNAFIGGGRDAIYKATNIPQGSYRFTTDEQLGNWPVFPMVDLKDPNRDVRPWDLWPNWGTKPPKTFVSATYMPQGQSLYKNEWNTFSLLAINGNLSANIFRSKYILINSAFPNYSSVATQYTSFYNYFFRTNGCVDASKVTSSKLIKINLNEINAPYFPFPSRLNPDPFIRGPRFFLGSKTDTYGLLAIPIESIKQIPVGKKIRYQFDTQWIHCTITSKLVLVQVNQDYEYTNSKHNCKNKPLPQPAPDNLTPCEGGCWDISNGFVPPCYKTGYPASLPKGFKYAFYKLFGANSPFSAGCTNPSSDTPKPIATPNYGLKIEPYPMMAYDPQRYWFDFQKPIINAIDTDYINFQNLSFTKDKESVAIAASIPRPTEDNSPVR